MTTKRLLARRFLTCVALRQEAGQVLALVVVALIPLLGMVGLALDIGYAYYSQRTLQSSADAAALAGASKLPDAAGASSVAAQYGTTPGSKNAVASARHQRRPADGLGEVRHVAAGLRAEQRRRRRRVRERDHVLPASLRRRQRSRSTCASTACGPCADRPADIVAVFDRTGSMCETWSGANDPSLHEAEQREVGDGDDAALARPEPRPGRPRRPPAGRVGQEQLLGVGRNAYNSTSSKWLLVPLTASYQKNGVLDHSSTLVSTIDCLQAGGTTSYANAIEAAQAELAADARPGALRYIVFFTDGAANTGPTYYSTSSPYRTKPCHQGVTSAGVAKAANTTIFAIGYTLQGVGGTSNTLPVLHAAPTETGITAYSALQQIASRADTFFDNESVDGLDAVFAAVATRITGPRLIPNDLS